MEALTLIANLGNTAILAQSSSSFNFQPDNFQSILGAVLGLVLLIAFVAATGKIAWEFFVSGQRGGADMEVVWRMVFGVVGIIIFAIIWVAVFGSEFIVDATLDDFDGLEGGGTE